MKKPLLLFYFTFCILHFTFSQNPLVKQWDKRFGGKNTDELYSFQQTSDGGYILGGLSWSGHNGDKSQNNWGRSDYWIIKIDSLGNKQWDKNFGGIYEDDLYSLQQTKDGGYILGGISASGVNGDKTQNQFGQGDFWIVKIDSLGNKQWDKDFGGTDFDYFHCLKQTADGGYILGGLSDSPISGNKTQNNWGEHDYWIVKIDSLGNKQWDKDFGGNLADMLTSFQQTADGGYILGGSSYSGISGDKTQPNWDPTHNSCDSWIIKIDSLGNKQWDKTIGGDSDDFVSSILQTIDGGYLLGGSSASGISGDKTQNTKGGYDYWIVKIDSSGIVQWDKDIGGADFDILYSLNQTNDGGYILGGTSASNISGDKTENNLGGRQVWIVKTDSLINKQWDKTIFTTGFDIQGLAIQTQEGCYAVANYTKAGVGGYKTQPNWDTIPPNYTTDYWIIKFCDSTLTTSSPTLTLPEGEGIVVAPNPFTSDITVTLDKVYRYKASFTVKNILGQAVYRKGFSRDGKSPSPSERVGVGLDLSFLSKGIYILETTIDGERIVKKIVKE